MTLLTNAEKHALHCQNECLRALKRAALDIQAARDYAKNCRSPLLCQTVQVAIDKFVKELKCETFASTRLINGNEHEQNQ